MSLLRVLYVSSARLGDDCADVQVQKIVDQAVIANAAMQLTGALMFDGDRFAQVIEGPASAVTMLIERIAVDPRHKNVVFVEQKEVEQRLFDGFSLAYRGRSMFVARTIGMPLVGDGPRSESAIRQLIQLMLEFAR